MAAPRMRLPCRRSAGGRVFQGFGLKMGDSLQRVIILASIVEKEAKYQDERPIIARVFMNRLGSGRPLESCATVFYSLKVDRPAVKKQRLTDADLETE